MSTGDEQDVTLYTKPGCVQCTATERQLDRAGVEFTTVDLTKNPDALEHVKDLGYQSAPVVEVTSADPEQRGHWSGFRPDLLPTIGTDHVATAEPASAASLNERLDAIADRAPIRQAPAREEERPAAIQAEPVALSSPGLSR